MPGSRLSVLPAPQQTRRARPVLIAAGGTGALLLLGALGTYGTGLGTVLAVLGSLLVLLALALAVRDPGFGWRSYESYPDLGQHKRLWLQAGASPAQLNALNEIFRLQRLNPRVGYSDRQTVVDPLADAYAIFSSPAWQDPWLADRQLSIDPIAEAGEIVRYLSQVTRLLRQVRLDSQAAGCGSATRARYEAYERELLRSVDVALRHASALTRYRHQVGRLERLLADRQGWSAAAALGDRVMDVVSESVRHDLAASQLHESRVELRRVEHDLREVTAILTDPPEDSSGGTDTASLAGWHADPR